MPYGRDNIGDVSVAGGHRARDSQVDVVSQPAIRGEVPVLSAFFEVHCHLECQRANVGRRVPANFSGGLILAVVSNTDNDIYRDTKDR